MSDLAAALERSASEDIELIVDGVAYRFSSLWTAASKNRADLGPLCLRNDISSINAVLTAIAQDLLFTSLVSESAHQVGHFEASGLIQQSSGTTGEPKSVHIDWQSLYRVIASTVERIGVFEPPVRTLSWMPLSHDLGLVGMLLCPLVGVGMEWHRSGTVEIQRPQTFVLHPSSWLRACFDKSVAISALTPSAIRALRYANPHSPGALTALQSVVVGGEFIRAEDLAWLERFLANGVAPRKSFRLRPAYGCAEAGLTLSMTERGSSWRVMSASLQRIADGVLEESEGADALPLVSCGTPLAPTNLRIVGGSCGRIEFRRDSNAEWIDSGDLGYLSDGELFIAGRSGDFLRLSSGEAVFAPDLDRELRENDAGVRAAVACSVAGEPGIGLLVASRGTADQRVAAACRVAQRFNELHGERPAVVAAGGRLCIPYTPSGKVRRLEAGSILNRLVGTESVPGVMLVSTKRLSRPMPGVNAFMPWEPNET